jgi:hypothetical protein
VVGEVAEVRPADAGPFVDEQHLVGDPVPIEGVRRHRLGGPDDAEDDVVVEVQRNAAADRVALRLEAPGLRQPMAMEPVVGRLESDAGDRLYLVRLGRWRQVVDQRAAAGEPLDPEQLLGVEAAVRRAVLGVALAGDAAAGDVIHGRLASSG